MTRFVTGLFLLAFLAVVACGDLTGSYYENVDAVVSELDRHTLSDESESWYQLVGAYDGAKFTVTPGDYRIEIYVYRFDMPEPETLETAGSIVVRKGNVILIFHTTDQTMVDSLVGDLKS